MYVCDERPYHWNSLEAHLEHYDIHSTCAWLIRGDIPPRPTFPFVSHSWDSELKSSTTIYSSSDHPMFSDKAQGPIYNLGLYPYTNDRRNRDRIYCQDIWWASLWKDSVVSHTLCRLPSNTSSFCSSYSPPPPNLLHVAPLLCNRKQLHQMPHDIDAYFLFCFTK